MAKQWTIFRVVFLCIVLMPGAATALYFPDDCDDDADKNVQSYDDIKSRPSRLLQMMLDNYGPVAPRPVMDQSAVVDVGVQVIPMALLAFEDTSQQVTVKSSLRVMWRDEQLVWDPNEHGGVKSVSVSVDDIWTPDLTIPESIGESFETINNLIASVNYQGNITWYNVVVTVTFCKLLIRYFPLDVQHCNITYTSWLYDTSKQNIVFVHDHTGEEIIDSFEKNGMWALTGIEVDSSDIYVCTDCIPFSRSRYILELKRTETAFYALNVILPCSLLSLMNLLVFFLPPESGEKISFVMTNVLTLVLFQQLVATMIPASGDDTPLFSMHIVTQIIFGCVAITWTVIVIHVYYKTTPFPKLLFIIFTSFKCLYRRTQFGKEEARARKTMFVESNMEVIEEEEEEERDDEEDYVNSHCNGKSSGQHRTKERLKIFSCLKCGKISPTIIKSRLKQKKTKLNYDPKDANLWQETAILLDHMMGYMMILSTLVVYIVLLVRFMTHNPKDYLISKH